VYGGAVAIRLWIGHSWVAALRLTMDFRVLGPLEVSKEDRPVDLGGPTQRALLAVLLLHAGEVVSVDRLIDQQWGDEPPATAVKTLQAHVSRLRRALNGAENGRLETR
jgi:DNA-binding SARP family transcriptional activator